MAKGAKKTFALYVESVTTEIEGFRQDREVLQEREREALKVYKAEEKKLKGTGRYARNELMKLDELGYLIACKEWWIATRSIYLKYLVIFSHAVSAGGMPIKDALACAKKLTKEDQSEVPQKPKER